MIIMLANILMNPGQGSQAEDFQLAIESIEHQKQLLADGRSEVHESLFYIIDDLRAKAAQVVGEGREGPDEVGDMFNITGAGNEQYGFLDHEAFLELESHEELPLGGFEFYDGFAPEAGIDGVFSFMNG